MITNNKKKSTFVSIDSLGSAEFKEDYSLKYPYIVGSMYQGISSKEMVVRACQSGMIGFFGAGGLNLSEVEEAILYIKSKLPNCRSCGMNLIFKYDNWKEEGMVDLYLKHNINLVEASSYITMTPAMVKYRLKGLKRDRQDQIIIKNKIIGKISRPEIAKNFMSPPPQSVVQKLLTNNFITSEEADLAQYIPMADDICIESDSGGHTDSRNPYVYIPAIINLRNLLQKKYKYPKKIRIGAAGGIGTPEAAASAFILGADFILTGSINQCTVEARTSSKVKDLLQDMNIQDTEYAPAGDTFEYGSKIQVLKKGLLFPARANNLSKLYQQHNSLDELSESTKKQLETKYFKRSFMEIINNMKRIRPDLAEKMDTHPKYKMLRVFKWYLKNATFFAIDGNEEYKLDYQINCGPALGAFNQWIKDTPYLDWRKRNVDTIGIMILENTVDFLNERLRQLTSNI